MKTRAIVRTLIRTRKFETIRMLFSKKLTSFHFERSIYDTGYSVETTWCNFDVGAEFLRVYIHDLGFVSIHDSPHYNYLRNLTNGIIDDETYKEYISEYYPDEDVSNAVYSFNLLYAEISQKRISHSILVELPTTKNGFIKVIDGTHRLAILTILGSRRVSCKGKL
jgi:hypothetical protein